MKRHMKQFRWVGKRQINNKCLPVTIISLATQIRRPPY
uniref:Uncharacterized protein n=1 Tax=Arundo donax TaxID=35708 RepID=A0A0A9A4Q9_ARUDO